MFDKLKKHLELLWLDACKGVLRQNPRLTYLFWECTLNCNFFCKHCGSSAGKKIFKNELTTKQIKQTFKEISRNFDTSLIMLAITGGEPLLRPDLFEVMTYAHKLGFKWGMVTNGFLVTPKIVSLMKRSGMKSIVISIDGLNKKHDSFRGMPNAYNHAINAVRLLANGHFLSDLQITTSVHKGNINDLEAMYNTFTNLGITSWRVINVDSIGRASANNKLLLNGKELKHLLDFIKEKRKQSKIKITYGCAGYLGSNYEKEVRDHYFYCDTGINTASILHNGDIFVCPNVPRRKEFIQGNVKVDDFSEVWKNKFKIFRDKYRTSNKKCLDCKHWEECFGGSFHLWDFDKNKTKLCHIENINNF